MKNLFVFGKEGKTLITAQSRVTSVKEIFTDCLAFYNKDNDLIAIIPKLEITAICTAEEVE